MRAIWRISRRSTAIRGTTSCMETSAIPGLSHQSSPTGTSTRSCTLRRSLTSIAAFCRRPPPSTPTSLVPGASRSRARREGRPISARIDRRGLRQHRRAVCRRRSVSDRTEQPVSASKASSELLALAYVKTFGLLLLITRASNNFGPYQFPEKLIPLMIFQRPGSMRSLFMAMVFRSTIGCTSTITAGHRWRRSCAAATASTTTSAEPAI